MFVERLLAALSTPRSRLGELDDALVVDVDRHRALLMREARALSEAGQIDAEVASWAFTCIADGWIDDHLHSVRDGLIELGAVTEQGHLDRLLGAAMLRILGADPHLSAADSLILETVTQPQGLPGRGAGDDPLGLRLLARHYALEVGLLSRGEGGCDRTPLGDTALRLPRQHQLTYLLALEARQSGGGGDPWRTPRRALEFMLEQGEFDVPATAQARRVLDPEGLLRWRRVGRLALMGLCEPAPSEQEQPETAFCCRYRLLPHGREALREVLRDPPGELVRLADALLQEQTRQALRPLLQRSRSAEAVRKSRGEPERPREAAVPVPTMRAAVTVPGHRAAGQRAPAPAVRGGGDIAPQRGPEQGRVNGVAAGKSRGVQAQALARELEEFYLATEQAAPTPQRGDESASVSAETREPGAVQELDLQQLVWRAWEELHIQKVRFEIAGPGATLSGDRRALLQIWRELLRSAAESALLGPIEPTPWGQTATVRVEFQPGRDEVAVEVHDSGPPLTPVDREGILDPSLGLLTEGSRSGLMRAHRMLVGQGGALVLLPAQGGGTLVRVVLPRAHRQARRAAA